MARTFAAALSCAAFLAFLACAPLESDSVPAVAREVAALQPAEVRGITLQMPFEHTLASGGVQTLVKRPIVFAGPGQAPLPIYMNRYGGTYSPGNDDSRQNTSIIP